MSTKTLRKRISLVAVSALGFGILSSVAPANAVTTLAVGTITQTDSVVRASTSAETTVNLTLTGATVGDKISARVDAVPAGATGATVEVGDVFQGSASSATAGSVVIGANKTAITPASCSNATTGAAAASASRSLIGVVTITTAAAHGFNAGQVITTSAALVWDAIDDNGTDAQETLLGAGAQITILNVTSTTSFTYLSGNTNELETEDTTTTANLLRAVGVYTAATGGAVNGTNQVVNAGDTAVDSGTLVCATVLRPATITVANDWMAVAGTYTFTFWEDVDSDGVKDVNENLSRTASITVGGTPTSITVVPQTALASIDRQYDVWVSLKDAAGNATKLVGNDRLIGRIVNNPGSNYDRLFLDGSMLSSTQSLELNPNLVETKDYYRVSFEAGTNDNNARNGSVAISFNFGGTIAPLAAAVSASVSVLATREAASLSVKAGQVGVTDEADDLYRFPSPVTGDYSEEGDSYNDIYANPLQATTITYVIEGRPNSYVDVEVSSNGEMALPTGVLRPGFTFESFPILLNSLGQAEFTRTATAAPAGSGYTIYVDGAGEFDVFYDAPSITVDTITVDELPTGVTKVLTPVGGTTSFTLTVADEYNNKYAGYFATLTTGSTSRNPSRTVSARTGLNGVANVSLADSGTTGTDVATVRIFAPNDTVTAINATTVATITYAANVSGSLSVGGGTNAVTEFFAYVAADGDRVGSDLDLSDGTPNLDEACVEITHVLRDAALAPITGYAARFTAVTPGLRFLTSENNADPNGCDTGNDTWSATSESVFAHANNSTRVYALASKTGVNEVSITAGGYTQTVRFTALTHVEFARNLVVTSPTTTTRQGSGAVFTALVTDGFGNPVPMASVYFSVTAGRSLSGASAVVVPADINGRATLAVTSDSDGVVGVTTSILGGQTNLGAGVPVAGFTTSTRATNTATIEGLSVSAENAQAALDAAQEATDAANAATDAANAAAEAADAATAAAQDAADAVAALSTQVSAQITALRKQITSLTNLIIKIQKKVRA